MKAETYTNQRMRTCLWIVNTLERHKALTREEINDLWMRDVGISDGNPMERRTFYNYLLAIGSLLKIVIECDRRDGCRYKITGRYGDDQATKWLLGSFATSEAVASSADIRERVLLEDIPSGYEHLNPIMEAMRVGRKISFDYQPFGEETAHPVSLVEPYCVKLYHQRWYVVVKEWHTPIGKRKMVDNLLVYSLDRIKRLEVTNEAFVIDPTFDAKEFFRYAFGTRVVKDNPPCTVRLKVAAVQVPYFRTLPLHHSQHEVETTAEYSIFELNVALTVELTLQILSYGSLVEVLGPEDLRIVVEDEVRKAAELYGLAQAVGENLYYGNFMDDVVVRVDKEGRRYKRYEHSKKEVGPCHPEDKEAFGGVSFGYFHVLSPIIKKEYYTYGKTWRFGATMSEKVEIGDADV